MAPITADDLWHPDHLARLVARAPATSPSPVLTYAPCRLIDDALRVIGSGLTAGMEGTAPYRMLYANLVGGVSGTPILRDAAVALGGDDERLRAAGCDGYRHVPSRRLWRCRRLPAQPDFRGDLDLYGRSRRSAPCWCCRWR